MQIRSNPLLGAALLAALLAAGTPARANDAVHGHAASTVSAPGAGKVVRTQAGLRDLWLGHAFWVRAVVAETLSGNAAAAAAAEAEAVNNAKQIAAAMEPFYGAPASGAVLELLGGHYTAVKQYLLATRARNAAAKDAARRAMTDNAEQIAVFLSRANPNLPIDALRGMLLAHGGHHVQQIQQIADKQYVQEAQTWDAMKNHMYGIADALTLAIAKQFPAKFE